MGVKMLRISLLNKGQCNVTKSKQRFCPQMLHIFIENVVKIVIDWLLWKLCSFVQALWQPCGWTSCVTLWSQAGRTDRSFSGSFNVKMSLQTHLLWRKWLPLTCTGHNGLSILQTLNRDVLKPQTIVNAQYYTELLEAMTVKLSTETKPNTM